MKHKEIFLLCEGQRNLALIKNKNTSLELLVDKKLNSIIKVAAAGTKPPLLNINQIYDAGFESGVLHWVVSNSSTGMIGLDMLPEWTLKDGHTLYMANSKATTMDLEYHDPVAGEYIPVQSKAHYQVGGFFGLHRCKAFFIIDFYNQFHQRLQKYEIPLEGRAGGQLLENYVEAKELLVTHNDAAFVKLSIKKMPHEPNEKDSFVFFTQPFFALVSPDSRIPQQWKKCPFGKEEWTLLRSPENENYLAVDFQLPDSVYDGQKHTITLINKESGTELYGSPKEFVYTSNIKGAIIGLEGSRVYGWVSELDVLLELFVDEALVASAAPWRKAEQTDVNAQFEFRITLPEQLMDGRPHRLVVRASPSGKVIGELAEIMPFLLTPWDALQKYTCKPLPAKLSPAAAYRYDSLRASLLELSEQTKEAKGKELLNFCERIAMLGRLHEQLLTGFEKNRNFESLVFPKVENPEISIVIPVHNKFPVTYNCLVALLFAYNRASFEVIVVDDGSSDETRDMPELVQGITYLRNETAQGFILSCNRGAKVACGRYIVMLNNDTEPTVHWLDELLFVFKQFDHVGMAGSKLLYPDGSLQEAGGIVWKTGNPWNYGRSANPHDPRFNYTRQVDYLSGASVMLPKILWDEIGGFSEEYIPAYFEDTDLAFKVRAAGYKTVYTPLSVVYHFEGVSSGTSVTSGIKRYQEINRPKFKQKWVHACRLNGEEGSDVDLNKDRGVNYRALVIDYQTPRPDIDAGSYAAIQEMRLLQSLGFKVTFIAENFAYMGQYTESLQRMGIEVIYAPFAYSMSSFLESRGREFDVVYLTRYNTAQNHLKLVRQFASKAKILFCNADLHFLREMRSAIERKDQNALTHACKVKDEELLVMREVDVTLSYNPIEHVVILSHNLQDSKVVTCPWVVDVKEKTPGFAERSDIAFLGGFGHPPNKEAVVFFINHVMPILRRQLPEAKFRIYGSNVPEDIEKLVNDDIVIEGYVEDVADVYDKCRVFVAPLLTGAGIKGKVIDALAHGTPSVLSSIAAEGTPLRHELEVMIAETAQEWADAVTRLYTEQLFWEKISQTAQKFARSNYSFNNGRKLMMKALETADLFADEKNEALVVKCTRPSIT